MSLDLKIVHKRPEEEIIREIRRARKNNIILETIDVDPVVWQENITHNLGPMAKNVPVSRENTTLYDLLWHPKSVGYTRINKEYVDLIIGGLDYIRSHKTELERYNPTNNWGTYHGLLDFVRSLAFFLYNIKDYDTTDYIIIALT